MAIKVVTLKDKDGNEIFPYGVGDTLKNILDLFYPVGSYYETSSTTFNPNTAWPGTTWAEDSAGRVLVAKSASGTFATVGATGGEEKHTLSLAEMPKHKHGVGSRDPSAGIGLAGTGIGMEFLGSYTYGTFSTDEKGSSSAHNNLQPYKVIKRWHRTA